MANDTYLGVILAIAGAVFLIAFTIPYITATVQTEQTEQLLQDGGETYTINGELVTEATQITNTDAVITIHDDAESENHTISVGDTQEFNVSGDEINATVDEASNSANEVEVTYVYPPLAGYPAIVRTAVEHLPLLLVILGLATVVGILYGATKI